MPDEVALTAEQQAAQDDAAFTTGFDEVRGIEPPAAKEVVNAKSEPVVDAPAAPAAVAEAAPAEEMFHGMPVSKIKSAVALLDKLGSDPQAFIKQLVDGKMGEVKRNWIPEALKGLNTGKSSGFSPARLARLKEDYPDLHAILTEDLGEINEATAEAAAQAPASGVTPEQLEAIRTAAVEQAVQQVEEKALKRAHPDWLKQVNSEEFRAFMGTKTDEEIKEFYDSKDADYIGKRLAEFRDYKPAAPAVPATPAAAAPDAPAAPDAKALAEATRAAQAETRRSRIAAAVAPKGVGTARPDAPDDEAAFEEGFNKVRGRNRP